MSLFDYCMDVPVEFKRVQRQARAEEYALQAERKAARIMSCSLSRYDEFTGAFGAFRTNRPKDRKCRQHVTKCGGQNRIKDIKAGEYITVSCRVFN